MDLKVATEDISLRIQCGDLLLTQFCSGMNAIMWCCVAEIRLCARSDLLNSCEWVWNGCAKSSFVDRMRKDAQCKMADGWSTMLNCCKLLNIRQFVRTLNLDILRIRDEFIFCKCKSGIEMFEYCAVRVYYTWRFRIIFMRCRRFVGLKPIRMQSGRNVRMSITDLLCAIFWEGAHNQSLLQPPARHVVMQSILWFRGFARSLLLMFSNTQNDWI